MDALMNCVELLWNFVISIMWKLWICFAFIVFVHVHCGGIPLLNVAATEGSKTNVAKANRSASVRMIIKTARKLMKRNKLDDASEILNQATLSSEEVSENNGLELRERQLLAGYLHEIRSLCLYRKGDVIGSMSEMDRGLAMAKNPDSHLLTSANHCFQLFHKWCGENIDHFQQDIVMYFKDKKHRLEAEAQQKIANTSLLTESVHCLVLSDLLVRREIVEPDESTDLKKLCQRFYCLLHSQRGDDQLTNSSSSTKEYFDPQKSADEIKYEDLVKETEDVPIIISETPIFEPESENQTDQESRVLLAHALEGMTTDEARYFKAMFEAYTTPTSSG